MKCVWSVFFLSMTLVVPTFAGVIFSSEEEGVFVSSLSSSSEYLEEEASRRGSVVRSSPDEDFIGRWEALRGVDPGGEVIHSFEFLSSRPLTLNGQGVVQEWCPSSAEKGADFSIEWLNPSFALWMQRSFPPPLDRSMVQIWSLHKGEELPLYDCRGARVSGVFSLPFPDPFAEK
jgi:hypothetical protein